MCYHFSDDDTEEYVLWYCKTYGIKKYVRNGKWIGKILPYGYTKDNNRIMIVDEEEAGVYKMMVKLCLAGNGTNTIARHLNSLNIATRGKKVLLNGTHVVNKHTKTVRHVTNAEFQWRAGTIYTILTNPIYAGRRRYKGEEISAPSIIDEHTWLLVQSQLTKNRRVSRNHITGHFYLLKGLIRCHKCGCNFYGKIKSDERIYMCSSKRTHSCGIRSINLDRLNQLVWNRVVNSGEHMQQLRSEWDASGNEIVLKTTEKDIDNINSELQVLELRIRKLTELYSFDRLSLADFDDLKTELEKKQASLNAQLRVLEQKRLVLDDIKGETDKLLTGIMGLWKIKERLNRLENDEKRMLLSRLGVNVIVNWDPELRCHEVEITFAVNGYSYERKEAIRGKSQSKQMHYLFDADLLLKSIVKPDFEPLSALQLQLTEPAH